MKPECIILVGIQGCGKTTYANELITKNPKKNYQLISQDTFGKEKYKEVLFQSLNLNQNVIIDRINHTFEQRNYILKLAKKKGYTTKIINLNIELKECVKRLLHRENHPTFNPKTYEEATKVLYRFLKEYEKPTIFEADSLENPTNYDSYCLDLTQKYSKFILFGDIHGCFDEFIALFNSSKIQKFIDSNTAIVFIGDLIDKGPKIKEMLDFYFSTPNCFCVRGNHEFKLQRYLRGNSVEISHGFDKTLEQCNLDRNSNSYDSKYAQFLLEELDSLPFSIQIGLNDYIVHAGLHPKLDFFRQPKEYFLFARTYNPMTHSFNTPGDLPWFEYYSKNESTIFFGHNYHEKIELSSNVFSLDGYCVYGKELRASLIELDNTRKIKHKEFITQSAFDSYTEQTELSYKGLISQFEYLTQKGYLQKSEHDDLKLYNYTQKTIYEKKWSPYIMQARGIVFDSNNNLIARPFGKFFNINETEFTQLHNLPKNDSFEVYEKIDGVLGIVFFHNNSWRLTTRGDLTSFQGKLGQEILDTLHIEHLDTQYTYLFELVHPDCRIIVDYKDIKQLYLIGGLHTLSGKELDYQELSLLAKKLDTTAVKKIDSFTSLDEIVILKSKLPAYQEGFIIKFKTGLRVKLKGDEYLQLVKIQENLNSKNLINFLDDTGKIIENKVLNISEELQDEVIVELKKLQKKFKKIQKEIEKDKQMILERSADKNQLTRKEISQLFEEYKQKIKHPLIFFKSIDNNKTDIYNYILEKLKTN